MAQYGELRIGVGDMMITPPVGVELSGYGFYLQRQATVIHNHLAGQALVLEQQDTRVALITADLLAISAETTARTRALVEEMTGIPEDHVLIACSHTHSGPATLFLRGCGEVDPGYVSLLPRYLATAVQEAASGLAEVNVYVGETTLTGLAMNRVDPFGKVDTAVRTLEMVHEESESRLALFSFGCHPVCTELDDTTVSVEFPGIARTILSSTPRYDAAMFLQGSCGDINPTVAHTNIGEMRRVGTMLAGAAMVALAQGKEVESLYPLRCVRRTLSLPLAIPTQEELESRRDDNRALLSERDPDSFEWRQAHFWIEATESLLRHLAGETDPWLERLREAQQRAWERTGREPDLMELSQALELSPDSVHRLLAQQRETALNGHQVPTTLPCELQALQIGDVVLLAHPTELFAEFGLEIQARSPFPHTFLVGYANDFLGYIPNEAEFARRGYAADVVPYLLDQFPFAPQVGRVFVEGCLRLLHDLHG